MNMIMKMAPVIQEINRGINDGGRCVLRTEVKLAIEKWELTTSEIEYLMKHFNLTTGDLL